MENRYDAGCSQRYSLIQYWIAHKTIKMISMVQTIVPIQFTIITSLIIFDNR